MKKLFFMLLLSLFAARSQAQKKMVTVDGKAIYTQHCQTCHQVDGAGAQNMIPPLIKTGYVLGDKTALIKIVLNGLSGEMTVNGDKYANEMPSQAMLKDSEIAAVLTYIRNSFGNKAGAVTARQVKDVRLVNKVTANYKTP